HRGNKIRAVLAVVSLAEFNAGNLGDRVSFVRRLKESAQQRALGNRLRRVLRINAGAAKEQQLANAVFVRGPNDVVLALEILDEEFDRQIVVRLDPTNFRGREHGQGRFLRRKETVDGLTVTQIQVRAIPGDEIGEIALFELSNERAANEATMARDEDFVGFFHGPRETFV